MEFLKKLFRSGQVQETEEPLVLVFVPALAVVLKASEEAKGTPLEETEVLNIRDKAVCMTVRFSVALKMEESRGYRDITPENVWQEWCAAREEF